MQAFAQFGSDLDAATQAQLTRGERLVEVLKQGQYRPMPVELQVVSIFAVSSGRLDKLPVTQILAFEAALHAHLKAEHAGLLSQLQQQGQITPEIETGLNEIIGKFLSEFCAHADAEQVTRVAA